MRPEYIPDAMEIEHESFSRPWSEESFQIALGTNGFVCLAALSGIKTIGYICARQVADEAEILKLAVRPSFRGRGTAKALTRKCLDILRQGKCREVYLEVRESNLPARRIYGKLEFKTIAARKNYYSAPEEDAVIMGLEL
jgi:ribosomal-protein-alanine N-acetyltransferase